MLMSDDFQNASLRQTLTIDYDIYGAGEAELAWLDEEIGIVTTDGTAVAAGYELVTRIYDKITAAGYPIGHLKFLMDNGEYQQKISYTAIANATINDAGLAETDRMIILINARVQADPNILQRIVEQVIEDTELAMNCKIIEQKLSAFQPGYPRPTHRITFAND
jgi:hypothetical protein